MFTVQIIVLKLSIKNLCTQEVALNAFWILLTACFIRALGVLVSTGPSRHSFMQISMHTSWKTARGKYVCFLLWTGWKTTCRSSLIRAHQQHRLLRKRPPPHGHRTCSVDYGSTVTTSTTRPRGRISWSGPRSWACLDLACPESLVSCV